MIDYMRTCHVLAQPVLLLTTDKIEEHRACLVAALARPSIYVTLTIGNTMTFRALVYESVIGIVQSRIKVTIRAFHSISRPIVPCLSLVQGDGEGKVGTRSSDKRGCL